MIPGTGRKNTKMYQDPVHCGSFLNFFHPQKLPVLRQHISILRHFCLVNNLEGTAKVPNVNSNSNTNKNKYSDSDSDTNSDSGVTVAWQWRDSDSDSDNNNNSNNN